MSTSDTNKIVTIETAENGFVVHLRSCQRPSDDKPHVFQTFAGLSAFLTDHFTHRSNAVPVHGP